MNSSQRLVIALTRPPREFSWVCIDANEGARGMLEPHDVAHGFRLAIFGYFHGRESAKPTVGIRHAIMSLDEVGLEHTRSPDPLAAYQQICLRHAPAEVRASFRSTTKSERTPRHHQSIRDKYVSAMDSVTICVHCMSRVLRERRSHPRRCYVCAL